MESRKFYLLILLILFAGKVSSSAIAETDVSALGFVGLKQGRILPVTKDGEVVKYRLSAHEPLRLFRDHRWGILVNHSGVVRGEQLTGDRIEGLLMWLVEVAPHDRARFGRVVSDSPMVESLISQEARVFLFHGSKHLVPITRTENDHWVFVDAETGWEVHYPKVSTFFLSSSACESLLSSVEQLHSSWKDQAALHRDARTAPLEFDRFKEAVVGQWGDFLYNLSEIEVAFLSSRQKNEGFAQSFLQSVETDRSYAEREREMIARLQAKQEREDQMQAARIRAAEALQESLRNGDLSANEIVSLIQGLDYRYDRFLALVGRRPDDAVERGPEVHVTWRDMVTNTHTGRRESFSLRVAWGEMIVWWRQGLGPWNFLLKD